MVKTSINTTILRTNYDTISIILRTLRIILSKGGRIIFVLKKEVERSVQTTPIKRIRNHPILETKAHFEFA